MEEAQRRGRPLVVVVPALRGGRDTWQPLLDRLAREEALAGAHWLWWDHRVKWYSLASPAALAIELRARITQDWAAYGPFSEVILVGHSFGGMLIRSAYLLACGVGPQATQPSPWGPLVSRIILFAAVNRGVDPERRLALRCGYWLTRACPPVRTIVTAQLFKGSSYITNLRIQWIRHFDALGGSAPIVVQLLGTRDEIVTSHDSVDIEQFPSGFYIEIPEATHGDLHRLDPAYASDPDGRYVLLRDAFVHARPALAQNRTFQGSDRVVFVLHGIRATNRTWVKQTIDAITARWPSVKAIGDQYGYISALRFAIPMTRRRHLTWFQDAYSEALAHNPRATFDFIGHSNGTYLFGESLRQIPGMSFNRAVLVGSVLPSEYDWSERMQSGQIQALRVDGSSRDWPVGWLCSALRGLGMTDVGTGGFDGFIAAGAASKQEFLWYRGGHSAPLTPDNLPTLAEYALEGTVIAPPQDRMVSGVGWFAIVSRAARRLAPVGVLALIAAIGYLALQNPVGAAAALAAAIAVVFVLDII